MNEQLKIDKYPTVFVADMEKPEWDTFFMGLAYYYCTRSPDQQTKTGCVIVDWPSKLVIGLGYNGHPRGMNGLPTMREGSVLGDEIVQVQDWDNKGNRLMRQFHKGEVVPSEIRHSVNPSLLQQSPSKYESMIHADINAIVNCISTSTFAVGYLPFEPCENCFLAWLSKSNVQFKRIVILTSRPMHNFKRLIDKKPEITIEMMLPKILSDRKNGVSTPSNDPSKALLQAAQYCNLMIGKSSELSKDSASIYRA